MRYFLPRFIVLTVFVMAWAMGPAARPAMAADEATFAAEFERIQDEMKELWLEMHNFKPLNKYCLPPLAPPKMPHIALMQAFGARTQALTARFRANKRSLQDFLAGNHEIERQLMRDDEKGFSISPRDEKWWKNSPYVAEAGRLQRKFNEKNAELKAKPERNCGAAPKSDIGIIGSNPPIEPAGPGIPLPPVEVRDATIPTLPARLCSQAEKQALLEQFWAANHPLYMNYQDAREYEGAIGDAMRENRGNRAALAALRPAASAATKRHAKIRDEFDRLYQQAQAMKVEDCGGEAKKEIGSLRDWSIGVEGAYGDLKIPKKPYLSLEVGGNQRLGVVDHKRVKEVAMILVGLAREFQLEGLPEVKIGNPIDQRWMTAAELFGYDLSIFSNDGTLPTTIEGVGIPGTGDPAANYSAGVFFGLPAINDVSNIDYSHKSEFGGLSLGLDQISDYKGWSSKLGIDLSFTRLETHDRLSGAITGYGWNFEYTTDVETRNFGLFVEGGAEVDVGDYWNSQLRYAGEFSGFRVGAEAKAGVNFLSAEGTDRLDLVGGLGDAQRVRIAKDDTTFGYQLGVYFKYVPPCAEDLELSIGAQYGAFDIHPIVNRSGQNGERSQIEFERQETFTGLFGGRFQF